MFDIVWFRQDLRLSDNLTLAAVSGKVLPIYILSDISNDASNVWLEQSLKQLNFSLSGNLNIYKGSVRDVFTVLLGRYKVRRVVWNKCYEPYRRDEEKELKKLLTEFAVSYDEFNSNYLNSPDDVLKNDNTFYKVFTAYKNKVLTLPFRSLTRYNENISFVKDEENEIKVIDFPAHSWSRKLNICAGEKEAHRKLNIFIDNKLIGYKENRNYPALQSVSCLSAHLHFGEISPIQVVDAIREHNQDSDHFISEIIWREFACYMLYYYPCMDKKNIVEKFDNFQWLYDEVLFDAWKKGKTGYPLVDAGMRELWLSGYMHNRVRMIVASFLIKNLNIHWHYGFLWFMECLVDADLANNSCSWQWVAGSGVDAAPYFRIFNPVSQGEKFDSSGEYTRKFVPELRDLPDKYLFKPYLAPLDVLKRAGITLGVDYPYPIVDLNESRKQALKRYHSL